MSAKLKPDSTPDSTPDAATYKRLVDALAIFTDATNQLAAVENNVQTAFAALVDEHRDEYAILQSQISESEAEIKAIAEENPKWFEAVKTVKTPYGSVGFRAGTKLEVPNEELTITLIELDRTIDPEKGIDPEIYLRKRTFLNIEALESLEDDVLKRFKIDRVTADKCTVSPAKVDLGKAVKKAAEKQPEPAPAP